MSIIDTKQKKAVRKTALFRNKTINQPRKGVMNNSFFASDNTIPSDICSIFSILRRFFLADAAC